MFAVADGSLIVTNYHVVDDKHKIFSDKNNLTITAHDGSNVVLLDILMEMPNRDLALLHIAKSDAVKPLILSQDDHMVPGIPVMVIGHQKGAKYVPTTGLFSGFAKVEEIQDQSYKLSFHKWGVASDTTIVNVSALMNSGNSGGPILNGDGMVLGVSQSVPSTARRMTLPDTNVGIHVTHVRELVSYGSPGAVLPERDLSPGEQERLRIALAAIRKVEKKQERAREAEERKLGATARAARRIAKRKERANRKPELVSYTIDTPFGPLTAWRYK